jgi:uncharacterized protein (TIGR03067 family)
MEAFMSARVILPWVIVLLMAAGTPAQNTKEELDKLQGEWTMVSLEENGRKVSDKLVKQYKLTIKENQWIVSLSGGQGRKMTFKIDPSKDPKTMDLTIRVQDRETISRGIYKLEGDTLTVRRTTETGDVERPQEFSTTPEEGLLAVWKRASK